MKAHATEKNDLANVRKALRLLKEKKQIPNENVNPSFPIASKGKPTAIQNQKYRKKFNVDEENLGDVEPPQHTQPQKQAKFDYNFEDGQAEQPVQKEERLLKENKNRKLPNMNEEEEHKEIQRIPCRHCGRKFAEEALEKHEPKCEQVFLKKRKEFNTAKKRIVCDDQEKLTTKVTKETKPKKSKVPKWKQQSEQFRRAVGKPDDKNGAQGHSDYVDVDRVECQYCGRCFNEEAAKRHVPFCKNKTEMNKMKASSKRKPLPKKK